jgi:predicted Zn-dependent peptidase
LKFHRHTLENGLEIVAECNDEAHTQAVAFFVCTGARDEEDGISGVSHFLEHMVFKGTPRRSAEDVNREFDEMGAHYNAFTSDEHTVYYAAVLPEKQEAAIDLLADVLRPSLREEDFSMEKKVILEEIAMYLDQPPFGADDYLKALYFGPHPLGRSVLGTIESISELSVDQMRTYFERQYAPRNLFVAAAGRVDFPALVRHVQDRCGDWQGTAHERARPSLTSPGSFAALYRESSTQQYILQVARGPDAQAQDRFAAKLLSTMLGDDSGSRMYWELVDPGIAEQATLGHYEYDGAGVFYTWASGEPDNTEQILECLDHLYRASDNQEFTPEELHQAKSKLRARVVLGSEKSRNRLFVVGGNWAQRREYRSVADDLAAVDAVTLEDVHRVARAFPLSRMTTVTVGPLEAVRGHTSQRGAVPAALGKVGKSW